jgi:hypothetical protein
MTWATAIDVSAAESQLAKHALEVFEKYELNFFPKFPNVLVRVLDTLAADRVAGRIILSQSTAKPYVDAIVLRSWSEKEFDGKVFKSELEPGNLVKMPYWGGIPVDPYATDNSAYRVIPENLLADYNRKTIMARGASQEFPHVFCKCHLYDPLQVIEELIDKITHIPGPSANRTKLAKELLRIYTIMPKETNGKTKAERSAEEVAEA